MTVGLGLRPTWLLNGHTFDPGAPDHRVKLGTTETWRLHNATERRPSAAHPPHELLLLRSRNGKPPEARERCLKDTFFMDPGEKPRGHRPLLRSPGQVHRPLPHARPRGPRAHGTVHDARLERPVSRLGLASGATRLHLLHLRRHRREVARQVPGLRRLEHARRGGRAAEGRRRPRDHEVRPRPRGPAARGQGRGRSPACRTGIGELDRDARRRDRPRLAWSCSAARRASASRR